MLEAEHQEEALVARAIDAGEDAMRRPDADPRALLGVDDAREPEAAAA